MAERKCPHCGGKSCRQVMDEKEWVTYQCADCGGFHYVPKKKEPSIWE
jgi:uncharacterized Zn finger protein